jgi:UDP-2,4-diacetamido-2,4,6-trideoxy-beta-L-altropyranose hydrolase
MIDLRPAKMSDSNLLFTWANDPVARSWSGSTAPIERADHERWMQFNVLMGYPQHIVMIVETEHGPVGVVRFDAKKKDVLTYTVSINMAAKARGQGLGYAALAEACRMMQENTLLADIRHANAASIHIFERCGFRLVGDDGKFVQYKRDPA